MVENGNPGVRAWLGRFANERCFVVENLGDASVFDVDLRIESEAGRNPPIVASEYDKKFPIAELESGEQRTLLAIITTGTGLRFRGELSWRDDAGTEQRKRLQFSV